MGRRKNKHTKYKALSDNRNLTDSVNLNLEKKGQEPNNLKIVSADNTENGISNHNKDISKINKAETLKIYFETYHPSSERFVGREQYVYSLCQVCKGELEKKFTCPKCQLVSYCSQEHRREHWPSHAELCNAVLEVCTDRDVDHLMQGARNLSPDEFRAFRFQNMVDCEKKVERPLEGWEKEIFIFPNVCGVCQEYKSQNLVACTKCKHSSFCAGHEEKMHSKWCELILQFKRVVKDQSKFGVVHPAIPVCKIPQVVPDILDIKEFFQNVSGCLGQFEYLELTEIATCPLTTLNTLLRTKTQHMSLNKVLLHVVGAESSFETCDLEKWEYYLLHLIPNLQYLQIEFIGPELNTKIKNSTHAVCKQCQIAKKCINFKFYTNLYHLCSKKSKPDLVCVFNPGLYRSTGFNGTDTWSPSIADMFAYNSPVLITEYTQREILMDVERVNATRKVLLKSGPTHNRFSSLKPRLNFVSEEESPVIFKNYFHCVMFGS